MPHNNTETTTNPLLADGFIMPQRWEEDRKYPGAALERYFTDLRAYEQYSDSIGVPCVRTSDSTKVQPRSWVSPHARGHLYNKDELGTEYITLTRTITANEPNKRVYTVVVEDESAGKLIKKLSMVTVPKSRVAELKSAGWEP